MVPTTTNNNNNNSDNDEVCSGKLPTWQHAGILKTIIAGKRNRAGDGDKDRNRHRYEATRCVRYVAGKVHKFPQMISGKKGK